MAGAAAFYPPDLTSTGVLDAAATQNGWNGPAKKQAQDWYNHFLEAVWNAKGTSIGVMNRKADDLWHVHKAAGGYDAYCISCFGYVVQHIENPPRRKATAAELAAVKPYYGGNWPIPDSITSCHS
jgi:hypothetical protein